MLLHDEFGEQISDEDQDSSRAEEFRSHRTTEF